MIHTPNNLSYSWCMFKPFNTNTTNMCAIDLNYLATKCHLNVYSFTHATNLKGHNMQHISECGNSIYCYFTSLGAFLSVKEMSLNPLHSTLLKAKTHLWKMALLFKRNISISFKGLKPMTFSANVCHNIQ